MSDLRIEIEPNSDSLFTFKVKDDLVPPIERLGLAVEGPEPAIEERSAETHWPEIILLTLNLAATALRDTDSIIEIVRKWLGRPRRDRAPKQVVKLYGPDGELLAEIEQDEQKPD